MPFIEKQLMIAFQKPLHIIALLFLAIISSGVGLVIAYVNPQLILDFDSTELKKWVALGFLFVCYLLFALNFSDWKKAYIFLVSAALSFNYTLFVVGISYKDYISNNIFGFNPWVLVYEPFVFITGISLTWRNGERSRKQKTWIASPLLPLAMVVFSGFLSLIFFSSNTRYSWFGLFALTKMVIVFIIFERIFLKDITNIKYLVLGFACLALLQSIIGITQAFQLSLPILSGLVDWSSDTFITSYGVTRVGGTMGRSSLEIVLLLILPVLLSIVVSDKLTKRNRFFFTLCLFLGTITVFLTGTRGPILSMMIGFSVVLYLWRKKTKRWLSK